MLVASLKYMCTIKELVRIHITNIYMNKAHATYAQHYL